MTKSIWTTPNLLSLTRLLMLFPLIILMGMQWYISAFILAILAFASDYADGKIARKYNKVTKLGTILDPVADKLVILGLMAYFTYISELNKDYFFISATRDIAQLMSIPILMLWKKIDFKVKPKVLAKLGTCLKYVILVILFLQLTLDLRVKLFLNSILLISSVIELYILLTYLSRFRDIYLGRHDTFE